MKRRDMARQTKGNLGHCERNSRTKTETPKGRKDDGRGTMRRLNIRSTSDSALGDGGSNLRGSGFAFRALPVAFLPRLDLPAMPLVSDLSLRSHYYLALHFFPEVSENGRKTTRMKADTHTRAKSSSSSRICRSLKTRNVPRVTDLFDCRTPSIGKKDEI